MSAILSLSPVPDLIARCRAELSADFDFSKTGREGVRISRSPGRLDVMGGIADYTGSLVCEMPIDRAAAVALQARTDRTVQVFSFNLFDEHQPFTLRIPLDSLATQDTAALRREFAQPGRKFAAYIAGCLHILHKHKLLDLSSPAITGVNLAVLSTVPLGGGVSSSAALEVATMINLVDHFGIRDRLTPLTLAAMCQEVENTVAGAPCGIMDQVASCAGKAGQLLLLKCQPYELQGYTALPPGTCVVGINTNVKHSVGGGHYGQTRCAAFMGHAILLHLMKHMAKLSGHTLAADPMQGYLANLNADDYKTLFRPQMPEYITGRNFLDSYGKSIDTATTIEPAFNYHVRAATDHHVLEAHRVPRFVVELEAAAKLPPGQFQRKLHLDRAGHLMYASHKSYTDNALLGADEADVLVNLVRQQESAGLYGAKITGGGSGGTVAVLMNDTPQARGCIDEIMVAYQSQTGLRPELIAGTSPGGWEAGTVVV
jgi:L-arabinokinase